MKKKVRIQKLALVQYNLKNNKAHSLDTMRGTSTSVVSPTLPKPRAFVFSSINGGSKAAKSGVIYMERTAGDMRKSPYLWWRAVAIVSTLLLFLSIIKDNSGRGSVVDGPVISMVDAAKLTKSSEHETPTTSLTSPISVLAANPGAVNSNPNVTQRRARIMKETNAEWFCRALLENTKPYDKSCKRIGNNLTCLDGRVLMFSQFQQDYYLFENHFKFLKRPGVYLDVAANDAIAISNSFFFDVCLGWNGGCIEANPSFIPRLESRRTCSVTPTCVGSHENETVEFALMGGAGAVLGHTNKHAIRWEKDGTKVPTLRRQCTTLTSVAERDNMWNIDYLSLDVEGHELEVLGGIDWKRMKINVLTIEVSRDTKTIITRRMEQLGYVVHPATLSPRNNMLGSDLVFLHKNVVWGNPV